MKWRTQLAADYRSEWIKYVLYNILIEDSFDVGCGIRHEFTGYVCCLTQTLLQTCRKLCNWEFWHYASVSEIIGIVSDMHACASQIIKHFSTKMSPGEHSADSLNSNPAKLCFVVKQSVREAAVGGYLNILCVENLHNPIC